MSTEQPVEPGDVRQVVERLRAVEALALGLHMAAADRGQQRPMTLTELGEVVVACGTAAVALAAQSSQVERLQTRPKSSWELRAEKAEADLGEVARQRDAYRERAGCLRRRLQTSERLRQEHLASPPAPSGWQQRIAAMEPWAGDGIGENFSVCHFCGVRRYTVNPDSGKYADTPHESDCLWQNAKDALPPAPPAQLAASGVGPLIGHIRTAIVGASPDDSIETPVWLLKMAADALQHLGALPPAPEASPAPAINPTTQRAGERFARCCEREFPPTPGADASLAKETA